MDNVLTRWLHRHKSDHPEATLEDVTPEHPNDYPARNLKDRLEARRNELDDIQERSHPTGMPDGPGGFNS